VIIPKERPDDDFCALRTRIAGEIIQKFVNYRLHLATVGASRFSSVRVLPCATSWLSPPKVTTSGS
jgi:hypothetical protein